MMNEKTTIGEKIDDFITYKHSLGYIYDTPERYLKHYQCTMEEHYPYLDLPDKKSIDCFLDKYKGQIGGSYNAMAPLRVLQISVPTGGYGRLPCPSKTDPETSSRSSIFLLRR